MATPYMNLDLPVVSSTDGPTWATMLDTALDVIDAHDHTSGNGVPIPSSAININADLTLANNSLTNAKAYQFYSQTVAPGDVALLYVNDIDLYYIDADGNSIRITENGAISAASFGGITGLVAPASAAYSGSTFTFKTDTNKYATMDSGDLRTRRTGDTSPNYVGIRSPASLAASYQLDLPAALPASTQFLTVSNAGAIAANIATSLGITRSMQAAVGQQISSSSGSFTGTATSYPNITNLTVTITTTGRPVVVGTRAATGASACRFAYGESSAFETSASLRLYDTVGGTAYLNQLITRQPSNTDFIQYESPSVVMTLLSLPAATYTFVLQYLIPVGSVGGLFYATNIALFAYEL